MKFRNQIDKLYIFLFKIFKHRIIDATWFWRTPNKQFYNFYWACDSISNIHLHYILEVYISIRSKKTLLDFVECFVNEIKLLDERILKFAAKTILDIVYLVCLKHLVFRLTFLLLYCTTFLFWFYIQFIVYDKMVFTVVTILTIFVYKW